MDAAELRARGVASGGVMKVTRIAYVSIVGAIPTVIVAVLVAVAS